MLRAAQKAAIEAENAPDERKRLREFSLAEVAAVLRVKIRYLNLLTGQGRGRAKLRLSEVLEFVSAFKPSLEIPASSRTGTWQGGEELATVVFTNFKGGSGKTTASVHFAQFMALAGYRVLLVDLDSQGSATAQFGLDPATEVGVENSFASWTSARSRGHSVDGSTLCQPTYWPSLDLVPAGAVLAQAEDDLSYRAATAMPEAGLVF